MRPRGGTVVAGEHGLDVARGNCALGSLPGSWDGAGRIRCVSTEADQIAGAVPSRPIEASE